MTRGPLARFTEATRAWFQATFAAPTEAQARAWEATAAGTSVLVSAPTGSGKTLAAFLAALDQLFRDPRGRPPAPPHGPRGRPPASPHAPAPAVCQMRTKVLYVSPLKALAYDIDRNLRAPLVGITQAAQRLGQPVHEVTVGMRTGDTPNNERRKLVRAPPDILITTPESLYLMLTSSARETLAAVETVIVDEVHALAGTKRGAHLAVSLERLEALRQAAGQRRPLQRVGLSATQRPLDEVARFLGGGEIDVDDAWVPRGVTVVEVPSSKVFDIEVVVPVEDMSRLGEVLEEPATGPAAAGGALRRSIWPAVHPRILELVEAHRTTIVFANSRRLAERLCASLNELAGEEIAKAHHGSVARDHRVWIEEELKAGRLKCVVATSSLELGIDMGAVDLVVQVESPGSVASGLQRIGRAGHQVGAPSRGKVFPKFRGDLVECSVVVRRMRDGAIEETRYPHNPLDVLAQQVVGMAAMDPWSVDALWRTLRGAASFADLRRGQLDGVLDMLSGRYPSDEFAELRPRLTWDRLEDRVTGRPSAQRIAVTSGGTIPDRGLYGVFLAGEGPGRRVGELDEEMVYETRPGETVILGASAWRIEEITRDQVLVTPAPGEPGKLPFWHGDAPSRPIEVGRAVGAFLRDVAGAPPEEAAARLVTDYGLDELAATNLVAYVADQREATGAVPDDRTIVVERFRDEIGDWRVCVLSPFGGRVHAPWALAIEARARQRLGLDVQTMVCDDGIVVRVPEADEAPPASMIMIEADEVTDLVVGELANSVLFSARFRECATRALLLPRRRPGGRTPLWQQRQKAADLLHVASRYGSFPILLETYRECLRDVFDLPALTELLGAVASRRVRIVQVETPLASPFASSLLFDYIAGYLYEGDAPLAERRAMALTLDRALLAELLGSDELRELIDPELLANLELELQRLAPSRHARSLDAVADLLREVGDLRTDEVAARTDGPAAQWLAELERTRRAYHVRIAGEDRWAAAEDAARFRDGLGVPVPAGLPDAFAAPVDRPLVDLVARYARTHGPFVPGDLTRRLGLPRDAVDLALAQLERERRAVAGQFRPGGRGTREWCDTEVLRRLRRRCLAALRREVEPVEPAALIRFLPGWQQVGSQLPGQGVRASSLDGLERTLEAVGQLQGAPLPASVLETDILPARVGRYSPAWLDELCATGEIVWMGRGPLGSDDGRIALYLRDQAPALAPALISPHDEEWWTPVHTQLLGHLEERGASFWPQLYAAVARGSGGTPPGIAGEERVVLDALWDLVWAGVVTNDTLAGVRALTGGGVGRARGGGRGRRARPGRAVSRAGPPRAAGRWSLVADLLAVEVPPTERAAALAGQLLDRHGVLVRGAVASEEVPGGFSAIYPVLEAMEESGRVRRGYFVEGLGGAQFALPGAVDRLRALRSDEGGDVGPIVLAATDPANPFGAALAWPDPVEETQSGHRARRAAGARIVLVDGGLVVYLERGSRSLRSFTRDDEALAAAAGALVGLVESGRVHQLRIERIDGVPSGEQQLAAHLRAAGFADHPRGLIFRGRR